MSEHSDNDAWLSDGGPAFPANDGGENYYSGMPLRDWFAGQALAGILSSYQGLGVGGNPAHFADRAYAYADAMLKRARGGVR